VRRGAVRGRSRLRRQALSPAAADTQGGDAPDLRHSLESTLRGLRTLVASLEGSGFKDAAGPYADMHLVLVQQRLWSRNQGRSDLDPLWEDIAATAGTAHEILSGFDAVMGDLAEIDRLEPATDSREHGGTDEALELARLFAAGTAVSGAALRARLSWPEHERRRILARLVASGVLERRGWGRSLSYRLAGAARTRVADELGAVLSAARRPEA
jgi:hypothetical protein